MGKYLYIEWDIFTCCVLASRDGTLGTASQLLFRPQRRLNKSCEQQPVKKGRDPVRHAQQRMSKLQRDDTGMVQRHGGKGPLRPLLSVLLSQQGKANHAHAKRAVADPAKRLLVVSGACAHFLGVRIGLVLLAQRGVSRSSSQGRRRGLSVR